MSNPFTSLAARSDAKADLREVSEDAPEWVLTYFAGVLSDLADSLPAEDPWRQMSAVIITGPGPDQRMVRQPAGGDPVRHDETGAWLPSGRPLNSPTSMLDLLVPSTDDLDSDPAFVMYAAEGIDPLASALVAFAFHTAVEVRAVLKTVYNCLLNDPDILGVSPDRALLSEVIRAAETAMRWLAFRRSAYYGEEPDEMLFVAAYSWIGKAERVNAGAPLANESNAAPLRAWKIADGQYTYLTSMD